MQQQPQSSNPFGAYQPGQSETATVEANSVYNTNYPAAGGQVTYDENGEPMTEVDLARYPEPAESSGKIRGRADIIEQFFSGTVNRELLIAKLFYLFFFSAFGSLLPLMAIYFKNLGMSPTQAGILIGIRPLIGYISAPFWADLADRLQKGKIMLLASLAAWIIFNVPIGFIHPPATSCLVYNQSGFFIQTPKALKLGNRGKRSSGGSFMDDVGDVDFMQAPFNTPNLFNGGGDDDHWKNPATLTFTESELSASKVELPWQQLMDMKEDVMDVALPQDRYVRVRRQASPMKPTHLVGSSPYTLEFVVNYDAEKHDEWVSPTFSYTIFNRNDIRKVFFLFLLLIIIGEFFCCPSMTLADSAVLTMLGKENADLYGRQRMFASIGWGLTMFFVCLTLDNSRSFTDHPCKVHERERNYTVCFASFTTFMVCTMVIATRLPFDYSNQESQQSQPSETEKLSPTTSTYQPGVWNHPKPAPPPPGAPGHTASEDMKDALKNLLGKSKVFAQTTRQIPEWMPVLRLFTNVKYAAFMFVAWFMGFGIGLIFTFLFWHLQDYGGTSTVFGMASVVNHISEMLAYFLSYPLIRKIGHIKVLCLGLACSILRFLYISYIQSPWGVIPFELIQGVTHSAVWAAACSYIAHNTPPELRVSAQGVLTFVHNGAGRACGTIIGGIFSTAYGTTAVLRGYGFACIVVLIAFVALNFYQRDKGFSADFTPADDPHQVAQEMAHLAPHGVPGNPTIVRNPSNINLDSMGPKSPVYVPGQQTLNPNPVPVVPASNPFLSGNSTAAPVQTSSFGYGAEPYNAAPNAGYSSDTQYSNYNNQY